MIAGFKKLDSRIWLSAAGFGGLVLTVVCVLFQTMCFKYVGVSPCVEAFVIGLVLAVLICRYLIQQTKTTEERPYQKLRVKEFDRIMSSILVMFLLFSVFSFIATTETAFLLGIGGMSFSFCSMLIYLFFRKRIIKRENEN